MAIRLDDADEGPRPNARELLALRDAVTASKRAVTHWDEELQRRVQEVQSMDGMLSATLNRILGTQEARIERGIAAVQEAQVRLANAQAAVTAAEQAVAQHQADSARSEALTRDRDAELESIASRLRGTAHPAAVRLDEYELELDATEAEIEPTRLALTHGASLTAYLGAIITQSDRSSNDDSFASLASMAVGRHFAAQISTLQQALEGLPDRARAFEDACQAVGLRAGVSSPQASRSPAFEHILTLTGHHWVSMVLTAQRLDELRDLVRSLHEDTDLTVRGLQDRLTGLKKRATTLHAERRRLLVELRDAAG